jgi:hypothetical protein
MFVNVIDVSQEVSKMTKTNKPYTEIEVTFKSADNKVSNKKLNNLGFDKKVYTTFVSAKKGDTFEVTSVKEGDYWVWKDVVATSAQGSQTASSTSTGSTSTRSSGGNTYETPEERAMRRAFEEKKQILIVRQSSIGYALEFHKNEKGVGLPQVLETASKFNEWVHDVEPSLAKDSLEQEFDDVPN